MKKTFCDNCQKEIEYLYKENDHTLEPGDIKTIPQPYGHVTLKIDVYQCDGSATEQRELCFDCIYELMTKIKARRGIVDDMDD